MFPSIKLVIGPFAASGGGAVAPAALGLVALAPAPAAAIAALLFNVSVSSIPVGLITGFALGASAQALNRPVLNQVPRLLVFVILVAAAVVAVAGSQAPMRPAGIIK